MWDTPFDISMLHRGSVIIFCPEEALSAELMEVLAENGVVWQDGGTLTTSNVRWTVHRCDTCYWVEAGRLLFGSKYYAERNANKYANYTKCTFYGVDTPDFSAATDDELCSLLGV